MRRNNLSPATEEQAHEDLLSTLARIDSLEEEKKECSKAFRAILDEEWTRVRTIRGLLEGRISEQVALPGLEEDVTERDRRIGQTLRKAIDSLERITGVSAEIEDRAVSKSESLVRAVKAFKDSIPEGTTVTASVGGRSTTFDGTGRSRKEEDAPEGLEPVPAARCASAVPFDWLVDGEGLVARPDDTGCYRVEPRRHGFAIAWIPAGERPKWLATAMDSMDEAQAIASQDFVERQADDLLKNSGADDLMKADVKGPAVARRRGRRG